MLMNVRSSPIPMGGRRRSMIAGLAFLMLMGIAVYFRLWSIDYTVSSDDADLLRRQFDLANREAMDESAEWRLKYDVEADKARKCNDQLRVLRMGQTKNSSLKLDDASSVNHKLEMLKKVYFDGLPVEICFLMLPLNRFDHCELLYFKLQFSCHFNGECDLT